jgi:hypothetical protein
MSSSTTKDDEDRYVKMPIFNGDKDTYKNFMMIFEGWEDKEDVRKATSIENMSDALPTDDEYWENSKERTVIAADGTVQYTMTALSHDEKQLYKDNAKSKNKLMVHVHDVLCIAWSARTLRIQSPSWTLIVF